MPFPFCVYTSVFASRMPRPPDLSNSRSLKSFFHVMPPSTLNITWPPDSCRPAKMFLTSGVDQSTAAKSQLRPTSAIACQVLPPSPVHAHLPSSMKQASRWPAGSALSAKAVSQRPLTLPPSTRANDLPPSVDFHTPCLFTIMYTSPDIGSTATPAVSRSNEGAFLLSPATLATTASETETHCGCSCPAATSANASPSAMPTNAALPIQGKRMVFSEDTSGARATMTGNSTRRVAASRTDTSVIIERMDDKSAPAANGCHWAFLTVRTLTFRSSSLAVRPVWAGLFFQTVSGSLSWAPSSFVAGERALKCHSTRRGTPSTLPTTTGTPMNPSTLSTSCWRPPLLPPPVVRSPSSNP